MLSVTDFKNCSVDAFAALRKAILNEPDNVQEAVIPILDEIEDRVKAGGAFSDEFLEFQANRAKRAYALSVWDRKASQLAVDKFVQDVFDAGEAVDQIWASADTIEFDPIFTSKRPNRSPYSHSIATRQRAEAAKMAARVDRIWDQVPRTKKYGRHPERNRAFVKEVYRVLLGGKSDDKYATAVAADFRRIYDEQLEALRDAGLYIQRVDNYLDRFYNTAKIAADYDGLIELFERGLNKSRHPDRLSAEHIAGTIHAGLFEGQASSSITRKVWFDDVDAEVELYDRFGPEDLGEFLASSVINRAKQIPVHERFGPLPDVAMGKIRKAAEARLKAQEPRHSRARAKGEKTPESVVEKKALNEYKKAFRALDAAIESHKVVNESPNLPSKLTVLRTLDTFATTLALQGVSKTVAFFDIPNYAIRMSGLSHTNMLSLAWQFMRTGKQEVELGKSMGFVMDFSQGRALDKMSAVDTTLGGTKAITKADAAGQRLMTLTMKFNLMTWLTQKTQAASGMVNLMGIARAAGEPFHKLEKSNKGLYNRLRDAGISEAVWDRISREEFVSEAKGHRFLDAQLIDDKNARHALESFLVREVDQTATRPGDVLSSRMVFHTRADSVQGVLWRQMTKFVAVSAAFTNNLLRTGFREGRYPALLIGSGALIGLGALRTQYDQWERGEDFYDIDSRHLWAQALQRSGVFWIFGNMLADLSYQAQTQKEIDVNKFLIDQVTRQASPAASMAARTGSTMVNATEYIFGDDSPQNRAQLAKDLKGMAQFVPLAKVPQFAKMTNESMNSLVETLDPAYNIRKHRTFQKLNR